MGATSSRAFTDKEELMFSSVLDKLVGEIDTAEKENARVRGE